MDEKSLNETCLAKLQARGDKNCKVSNVRISTIDGRVSALVDVSYTWMLNGWEKNAEHKDMIFVYIDGEWKSPLFH